MNIEIDKKIPKRMRKMLRAAIRISHSCAPMHKAHTFKVIAATKRERKEFHGQADMKGNTAEVTISPTLKKADMLDTIFHECMHIHQMNKGELYCYPLFMIYKWVFIPQFLYEKFHDFMPFEKEAYKYGATMAKQYKHL